METIIQEKQIQAQININLKLSNIPKEYLTIDKELSKLKLDSNKNYYIHSNNYNSGKTLTVCLNGIEHIENNGKLKFILFGKLNQAFIDIQNFNSEINMKARELINVLSKQKLLIIDDCFDPYACTTWKNNPSLIGQWDIFLRDYLSNSGKLWITSNLNYSDNSYNSVEKIWGEKLVALFNKWNFIKYSIEDRVG